MNSNMHNSSIAGDQWLDRSKSLHEDVDQETYLDVLNAQLRHLFPDFVCNLQVQDIGERQRSRAAVIEYCDKTTEHKTFKSLGELQRHFRQPAAQQQPIPRRRLFLLEDLSRDFIEIIDSQFSIPPRFFGAYWADPAHPNFNYRSPFARYTENSFVVRYPSTLPIRVDAATEVHGTIFRFNANVNRHIHCYDPKGPLVDQPKSYHVLSFWSSGVRNDRSWDSVLLVDPPIRDHVVSLRDGSLLIADHNSKEHAYTRMHALAPDFNEITTLSPNMSKHGQSGIQPQYSSMFDDILSLTTTDSMASITPRSCTETARKLVISIFLTYLRRRILNMLRLQANTCSTVLTMNRCDYLKEFGKGALSSWQHGIFGFLVNVKYIMGILIKEADDNMVALGLDRNGLSNATMAPQWELYGWLSIQEDCTRMLAMAEAFLQSYLAFTTMQEAQAAHRNALSLARITNLTMVFIPLSAIAAIFSMTDEYLPGRERGWLFWATAVSVLVGTFGATINSWGAWKSGRKGCIKIVRREGKQKFHGRGVV